MSEPKLIHPMLDGFLMGDPISEHHGIRCCPAIEEASDKRYIVKIISIPASQVQLEALLLTGACKDHSSALAYFKELSEDVMIEVEILDKLSKLEGFVPYENIQIEQMDEGETGYEVYLLSPYRKSLERFFRKNTMTHLGAVNLGLDMCAALAVCRQAGYLYVNLKPDNIFLPDEKQFRIGDLGFIKLDSLAYSPLPEKYRSSYTPPEITDAFSCLNTTMDVYSLGLVLYQAYNGGNLPFEGQAIGEPLPSPVYADYEIAEIILKACAPKPEDRWQSPAEMGQALVGYMQRNEVNDVPIVPPSAFVAEDPSVRIPGVISKEIPDTEPENEDPGSLAFMEKLSNDDTAPSEALAAGISYEELSNETSDILAQADELLSHETPEGVVAPEPIDVPIPEPIVEEPEEPVEEIIAQTVEQIQSPEPVEEKPQKGLLAWDEDEDEYYDEEEEYEEPYRPKKGLIAFIILLVLLAGLAFGGYTYYKNYYLQNISSLQVSGSEDYLEVSIVSEIDETLLSVVCTDTYGNKQTCDVINGKASFQSLNPSTLYTVKVEIEGFHELTGATSKTYNTPAQTDILTFSAIAGSEDGSVILSFTVGGQDSEKWLIRYSAEGEEEKTASFSGHMVIINGLTVGKEYTFRLDSENDLYIVGNDTLTYNATSLVFAENLAITGCSGNTLRVVWDTPAMANVASWNVRCYNSEGFDQTITTEENTAIFSELDTTAAYTVEVIAQGMTAGSRCYVSANSVTIGEITAEVTQPTQMEVSWEYEGPAPSGNWLLLYSIDGSSRQEVIRTDKAKAVISPVIPNAEYTFTIALEDGSTVFTESFTATSAEAEKFSGYTVSASNMTLIMVKSEDVEEMTVRNWQKLKDCPFATTTFQVGQSVSVPVRMSKTYATSSDLITTLFVIRDENGELVSNNSNQRTWTSMWKQYNCTLQIPEIPDTPGKYTVEIYFNGMAVDTLEFEVVPAE